MSAAEEPRESEIDPALRRALENARQPAARAEFHERLRAEFLAAPFEARSPSDVEEQDPGPAPIVAPRWGGPSTSSGRGAEIGERPRSSWRTIAAIAAIAAAILLVYRWPTTSGWRVAASSDFTLARVDGVEFSPSQSARLAAALVPGSLVEVEGGSLELVLDRRVAIGLSPASAVRLVIVPEPEVLDDILLSQERGSLAVVTGPQFSGSSLRVRTKDTEVRAIGTEFAVDVIPGEGTCVCCAEGSVQVFDRPGTDDPDAEGISSSTVPHGEAGLVSSKGLPTQHGRVVAAHLAPFGALRRIWASER